MMGALESEKMPKELRICGLVVEFIVAIDETRVRFPADAFVHLVNCCCAMGGVGEICGAT